MSQFDFAATEDVQARPGISQLLTRAAIIFVFAIVTCSSVLPVFWIAQLVYNRPPIVVHTSHVWRYLKLTWTESPPLPGLSWSGRVYISIKVLLHWILSPWLGLAWLLDEVLYDKSLENQQVKAPIFVVSAGRSGSTQITRYIEADPAICAPSAVQCMFPYLWLWRLVHATLGMYMTPERVTERLKSIFPDESLERHPEFNPFKADTFDPAFLQFHLIPLSCHLGPSAFLQEFNFATYSPQNRLLWHNDFVAFVDRLGRKALLCNENKDQATRLYIKGHFLSGAPALANYYSDATFLTVTREPLSRIQSGINFMRVQPLDPALGALPWSWLARGITEMEIDYCRVEMEFFGDTQNSKRLAVRFVDLVVNPKHVLQRVYKDLLRIERLPEQVVKLLSEDSSANMLKRGRYKVDRSLEELGIDTDKLREQLAEYIAWCKGETIR